MSWAHIEKARVKCDLITCVNYAEVDVGSPAPNGWFSYNGDELHACSVPHLASLLMQEGRVGLSDGGLVVRVPIADHLVVEPKDAS